MKIKSIKINLSEERSVSSTDAPAYVGGYKTEWEATVTMENGKHHIAKGLAYVTGFYKKPFAVIETLNGEPIKGTFGDSDPFLNGTRAYASADQFSPGRCRPAIRKAIQNLMKRTRI